MYLFFCIVSAGWSETPEALQCSLGFSMLVPSVCTFPFLFVETRGQNFEHNVTSRLSRLAFLCVLHCQRSPGPAPITGDTQAWSSFRVNRTRYARFARFPFVLLTFDFGSSSDGSLLILIRFVRAALVFFALCRSSGRLGAHITVHRTGNPRQGPVQQGGLHRQIPADTRRARRSSKDRGPFGSGSCAREHQACACAGATVSPRAQGERGSEREGLSLVVSDRCFRLGCSLCSLCVQAVSFRRAFCLLLFPVF